ncbi:hypothetical protein EDC96DRAFT_292159 [Choanephora cucurbitarum]|nr:hypothetical protein EDC96DRAFT_292159 [Choanephora cucurbitarum]
MLHTSRMEIDIPTQPCEGKGKAPMNTQSSPKSVTFQLPMTGEIHTIPPAVPEDYASMDENGVVEEEDALKDADDGAPRNRLNGLKGFIKSLLLRDEDLPNEQDLTGLRSDLNEKETKVCLLILQSLKSYIPSKKNYSHIGYKLPFVKSLRMICCAVLVMLSFVVKSAQCLLQRKAPLDWIHLCYSRHPVSMIATK